MCSCHHPCRASPAAPLARLETPHSEGPICWRLGDLCQMSRRSVTLQSLGEAEPLWENPGNSWPGGGLGRGPAGERSLGASETGGSLAGSCPPQTRGMKKNRKRKGFPASLGPHCCQTAWPKLCFRSPVQMNSFPQGVGAYVCVYGMCEVGLFVSAWWGG